MSEALQAWIAALPPDAIAQVVNAHRDAWDGVTSDGKAPNAMRQYKAAAQAFRDALLSLVRAAGGGAPSGPWRIEPFKALSKHDRRAGWWNVYRGGQEVRPERPYALLETEVEAIAVRNALNLVASRSAGSEEPQ